MEIPASNIIIYLLAAFAVVYIAALIVVAIKRGKEKQDEFNKGQINK